MSEKGAKYENGGGMGGAAKVARPASQVNGELDELFDWVSQVEGVAADLEQKLNPVLTHAPPSDPFPEFEEELVEVASRIRQARAKLMVLRSSLYSVLERVEL